MVTANGASKAIEKDGIETYVRDGSDRVTGGMNTRVLRQCTSKMDEADKVQ